MPITEHRLAPEPNNTKRGMKMFSLSRRDLLKKAAAAAVIGADASIVGFSGAQAAGTITAIDWGGQWVDALKKIAAKQSFVDVNWQLYAGGAATILPKIKATWPNPGLDLMSTWNTMWGTIAREGWAVPITVENVPNLVDIPQSLLTRDSAGNVIGIPRAYGPNLWFYRKDTAPFQISTFDDLLDPRLKGKICFPAPSFASNLQMISIAVYKGGDEKNMEPAWDFMKKLARSGNIGRVSSTSVDITTSISSGETCISFDGSSTPMTLSQNFEMRNMMKMGRDTGFHSYIVWETWCVLKGRNAHATLQFANFAVNPENNADYNAAIGAIPTNVKSKIADHVQPYVLTDDEMRKYTYKPDWDYLTSQADAWSKRWEQEIMPLL
ncbi:MAG: extracellular solute-binding protein [Mesorhizobium sp.]|nr:MAG: extracellular solute-binding protein [Mesorhizobium sp.]